MLQQMITCNLWLIKINAENPNDSVTTTTAKIIKGFKRHIAATSYLGSIASSCPCMFGENRTAFLGVSTSWFALAGDGEDLDATRVNFGIRSLSVLIDCEARGADEAVEVKVEVDMDASESPREVGGVMVDVLVFVLVLALDFLSDDRVGGGGNGGTARRRPRSSPVKLICRVWGGGRLCVP